MKNKKSKVFPAPKNPPGNGYDGCKIIECNPGFESYFVFFNPFRVAVKGKEHLVKFNDSESYSMKNILSNTETRSWEWFLTTSGINSYIELENVLSFYIWANKYGTSVVNYKKFQKINNENPCVIPPEEDLIDEEINKEFIKYLYEKGVREVYNYSDDYQIKDIKIKDLCNITDDFELTIPKSGWSGSTITTLDKKLSIVGCNNSAFNLLMGEESIVAELIDTLNLEGFYCNNETAYGWGVLDISEEDLLLDDKESSNYKKVFNT